MNRAEYHATRRLIHTLDACRRLAALRPSDPGYSASYDRSHNAAALDHIQSLRARISPRRDEAEADRAARLASLGKALRARTAEVERRRRVEREVQALLSWGGWLSAGRIDQAMMRVAVEFGGRSAADVIREADR